MELTKEYFETYLAEQFEKYKLVFASKADIADVKEQILRTEKKLSLEIETSVEGLARMVETGFEDLQSRIDHKHRFRQSH